VVAGAGGQAKVIEQVRDGQAIGKGVVAGVLDEAS
jgi:hypothetical protein